MSRSIDLFIRSPKSLDEMAPDLSRITGFDLHPGSVPGTWSLDEGDVHAELRAHPYIDDGELVLERYQYALSARVEQGSRLVDSKEANLLRVVSEGLRQAHVESLLVHDLQYRDREGAPAGSAASPGAGPADAAASSASPGPGESAGSESRS